MAIGGNYDWLLKHRESIRELQTTWDDLVVVHELGSAKPLILDAGIKCPTVKELKMAEEQTFTLAEIETYLHNIDHKCNDYNIGSSDTVINTLTKYAMFLLADNKITELYVKRVERLNDALIGKFNDSI